MVSNFSIFLSSLLICFTSLQIFTSSQAASHLTPGQPLAVGDTLVSDDGTFELGFFSPGSSNRSYVGIWYRNSRGNRIVWVANRDSPISDSTGSFAIAADGNLILLDGEKRNLWSSNIYSTSKSNVIATLLDTGNLMLSNPSGRLWQSFDHPTDTYLPGMRVGLDLRTNKNQLLTCWRSTDDPTPGNFSLGHDPSGSTQLFLWEGGLPRWRSGLWNGQVFIGVEDMVYAYYYGFKLSNIEEENKMYYYIHSNSSQYWVLTPEGIYRHFRWNGDAFSWSQFWAEPVTACEEYNKCGNNAGCNDENTPICNCLFGFEPRSGSQWKSGNWTAGCVRKTMLGCHRNESIGEVRIHRMLITLAAVFSLGSLICLVWKYKKRIKEHFKQRRSQHEEMTAFFGLTEIQEEGKDGKQYELRAFSFHDMVAATDNFSCENLLGEGGFGTVYKGMLPGGQQIAVKRLSEGSKQGMEEFKNEVKLISKLQHSNLVRLEGFCIQGEDMMLIYEYMYNGSLEAFLFGTNKRELLDWKTRYNIIEAIARGLLYLHRDSRLGVIHRDLKASNILLDEKMNPKISDFGIAKIFGKDGNETRTKRIIGTYGYMSPEYAMRGLFSIKSDVYSFGVLLLEIVSGKKNSTYQHPDLCLHLLPYIWKLWNENNEMELVDPLIRESCQLKEVSRCIHVGLLCVQDQATDRPTMSSVVMMLEWKTTTHPMPREPIFALDESPNKRKSPNSCQEDASNDVSITLLTGR